MCFHNLAVNSLSSCICLTMVYIWIQHVFDYCCNVKRFKMGK